MLCASWLVSSGQNIYVTLIAVPFSWECVLGGIGKGEMNTTEGLGLDSKTQGFKLLGGLMLDVLMDMNVESPGAQCEGTDEF